MFDLEKNYTRLPEVTPPNADEPAGDGVVVRYRLISSSQRPYNPRFYERHFLRYPGAEPSVFTPEQVARVTNFEGALRLVFACRGMLYGCVDVRVPPFATWSPPPGQLKAPESAYEYRGTSTTASGQGKPTDFGRNGIFLVCLQGATEASGPRTVPFPYRRERPEVVRSFSQLDILYEDGAIVIPAAQDPSVPAASVSIQQYTGGRSVEHPEVIPQLDLVVNADGADVIVYEPTSAFMQWLGGRVLPPLR